MIQQMQSMYTLPILPEIMFNEIIEPYLDVHKDLMLVNQKCCSLVLSYHVAQVTRFLTDIQTCCTSDEKKNALEQIIEKTERVRYKAYQGRTLSIRTPIKNIK